MQAPISEIALVIIATAVVVTVIHLTVSWRVRVSPMNAVRTTYKKAFGVNTPTYHAKKTRDLITERIKAYEISRSRASRLFDTLYKEERRDDADPEILDVFRTAYNKASNQADDDLAALATALVVGDTWRASRLFDTLVEEEREHSLREVA